MPFAAIPFLEVSMKKVLPAIHLVASVCGKQREFNGPARLTKYCVRVPCKDGELLYHTLTGELLLLEAGESPEDNRSELIRSRFLVPTDFDDYAFATQVRKPLELMTAPKTGLDSCLIFTTTDCNARCFYCYELGRKRVAMSAQTAHDAAAWIAKNANEKKLQISWFGGEPLFNKNVIDIMTDDLRKNGIAFRSRMVSNGYLFDEETVRQACEAWKLEKVQITLDGTEEVYNRSKAYIYREGSAYRRVIRNIQLLLDAGIEVHIRLNLDSANYADLLQLCKELPSLFPGQKDMVYISFLQEFVNKPHSFASQQEALACYRALRESLIASGLYIKKYLARNLSESACIADSDHSVTILPDGRIGKCEHESEDHLVGSIYEGITDQEMVSYWKTRVWEEACRTCTYYPHCKCLRNCAWFLDGCTEMSRILRGMNLEEMILNSYEQEKNRASAIAEKPAAADGLC